MTIDQAKGYLSNLCRALAETTNEHFNDSSWTATFPTLPSISIEREKGPFVEFVPYSTETKICGKRLTKYVAEVSFGVTKKVTLPSDVYAMEKISDKIIKYIAGLKEFAFDENASEASFVSVKFDPAYIPSALKSMGVYSSWGILTFIFFVKT